MKKFFLIIFSSLTLFNLRADGDERILNKIEIYKLKEKRAAIPFLLNFFLSGGIGSFIQGDYSGGLIVLSLELIGITLTSLSLISSRGVLLAIAGGLIFANGLLMSWIFPFTFANDFNFKLREAIGLKESSLYAEYKLRVDNSHEVSLNFSY